MPFEKHHLSLTNPASPAFGVLSTVAMGALPLIDPSTLDDGQRRTVHIAAAVVTGLYVGITVGGTRLPLKAVAGVAAGAATYRFADAGEAMDARLVNRMRQGGVQHPRRWLAAGAAALTFAGFLGDRVAAKRQPTVLDHQPEQMRPLNPRVRGLVEGILGATEMAGAHELRAQLDVAQEVYWADGFTGTAHFTVPDELPRAVPHNQVFPVRARFIGPDGASHTVLLQVFDGQLDHLAADVTDHENADYIEGLLAEWPHPSEVVYIIDGIDGASAPVDS